MSSGRPSNHRTTQALSVQSGALSLAFHAVLLIGFSIFLADGGESAPKRRVVTIEIMPPTEVVAAMPQPLEVEDEVSEAPELLSEEELEEPETMTREFPPESPEPPPELDPLPFDDPRGVRVRAAPFSVVPVEKPDPVAEEIVPPPAEVEVVAPDATEDTVAPAVLEPGPTRGPLFVAGVEPEYPETSKRLGEHGSVICRLFVGDDGRVTRVDVVRSSGYPRLDNAALKALRGWRFVAALDQGLSVPSEFTHTVRFRFE